jgi:hypothetical protein
MNGSPDPATLNRAVAQLVGMISARQEHTEALRVWETVAPGRVWEYRRVPDGWGWAEVEKP